MSMVTTTLPPPHHSPVVTSSLPSTRAAVRLRDIKHEYGMANNVLTVLHGVDLDIHPGQLTLMIGPSGSGKTTLLTILGLLRRPTSGFVEINGIDVSNRSETELTVIRRKEVSFIFQSFNLLSALTAQENVQIALSLQGANDRSSKARSRELLESVGLGDRMHHLPAALSCGQQQRVAIARSLASPGGLVLADEPTSSLDAASARSVMEMLRQQARNEGRAVVVVTHDPRLEHVADRIIRIEDGRIGGEKETDSPW
jgi:putative ABC transport system ATP-binding protein